MKVWKISFWIAVTLLVVSNLFWIYQVIDNAVGHKYYQVNYKEYKENSDILKATLISFDNKNDLTSFLEEV